MNILICIDDTDNSQSRGTGSLARQLAEILESNKLGEITGITRHQLYVHSEIPYTSHNSSATISLKNIGKLENIIYICRTFLKTESATGSDAGLCIAPEDLVNEEVMEWGRRAKKEVLTMSEAYRVAERSYIYLEGLTGTHGGVIGALAGVGLRKAGNDGRFLWVKGMRKLMGVVKTDDIYRKTGVEQIMTVDGELPVNGSRIMLTDNWRPVLKNHKAVLIVEAHTETSLYEYKIISKDHLRRISS